jgi:hypothetical protein
VNLDLFLVLLTLVIIEFAAAQVCLLLLFEFELGTVVELKS